MSRITREQIKKVREYLEFSSLYFNEIAAAVGVNRAQVCRCSYKTMYGGYGWSQGAEFRPRGTIVRRSRFRLTPKEAREIVLKRAQGGSLKELANEYKVCMGTIVAVSHGRIWKAETIQQRKLADGLK